MRFCIMAAFSITSVFRSLNAKSLKISLRVENVLSLFNRSGYLHSTYIRGIPGGEGGTIYYF